MGDGALHIAMLPWLAFGHMIPFLHLAIALANAGSIRISFLCTPRNIRRLPKVPDHLRAHIDFVELPMPSVEGLPEDAECTSDVSLDLEELSQLKKAHDLLEDQIRRFIADESPDWILYDCVPYWIATVAREYGVPSIFFSVFSAAALAFFGPPESLTEEGRRRWRPSPESMTSRPEWVPFPSAVAFRRREAEGFYSMFFGTVALGVRNGERFGLAVEGCEAVAVRSCNECEGDYLELLGRLYRKPVIPVGLLPPVTPPAGDGDDRWAGTFRWLDGQKPKSVLFVSFGSECKLREAELHELAHGLDLSCIPFLWALRRPAWVSGDDEEALPQGFTDRTKDRGVVSFGWAPQLEILAHPSIGGSLFHSGWGSIIETLRYGHALVLLPFIVDQGLNARLLVEKGLAVEVERDEDGSFHKDSIARALRMAMLSDEGEGIRIKAREMRAVFADQALHDNYVSRFIDYLLKNSRQSATKSN